MRGWILAAIDGLVTYTMDSTDEIEVARARGRR